ncbi:MAG: LPS-assembly protein LptD [Chthonomonas sp.]|nr:LPS-assembly protein LptD [Chthonomonas sp.]
MRSLGVLAAALLVAIAPAQMGHLGSVIKRGVEMAKKLPTPPPKQTLPEPKLTDKKFVLLNAGDSQRDGDGNFAAKGDIHFLYRGFEVFCDEVVGNFNTRIFEMTGRVRVQGKGTEIAGSRVVVNFLDETYEAEGSQTVVKPESIGNRLTGPLYITSDGFGGGGNRLVGRGTSITSCDRTDPHYHIEAVESDLRRGDRLILRGASLHIGGKKIFSLPTLTIPLNERGERYTPKMGYSRDEGYYILNQFSFARGARDIVTSRVDYFTRLGFGLGADYRYGSGARTGLARVYGLTGASASRLASIDHRDRFLGADFTVSSVYQANNYLVAPGTTNWTTRAAIGRRIGNGATRLTWNRTDSDSSTFNFKNSNFALSDQRELGGRTRTSLDLILSGSESKSTSSALTTRREQLDLRFRATKQLSSSEFELLYQRAIPIETTANFFSAADRTPLFTWRTESSRWGSSPFAKEWPIRAELSVGELSETQGKRLTRTNFDGSVNRNWRAKNGSEFRVNSRFRQSLYSDDTAQFVVALDGGYRWQFGKKSYLDWRHNYLQPEGFTPLGIDRSGKSNLSTVDMLSEFGRGFRAGFQTGYDFRNKERNLAPWQLVNMRLDYEPTRDLYVRTTTSYDSLRAKWQNVRINGGLRFAQDKFLNFGTRFDAERHVWGNVNIYAEGLTYKQFRFNALLSYNGYLKQFESRQLQAIYDMHCTELIVQVSDTRVGFRRGTEFGIYLRIKAVPFETPFGIGRRGQALGTGTGFGN